MKEQLDRIEAKLDRVIKALQEYDGLDEDFNEPEDEYAWENINSAEAEKHNRLLDEIEANKRMDIIGQNGNEGLHYEEKPKPKKKPYYNKNKKNGNNKKSS
jgi:hypothetical protein